MLSTDRKTKINKNNIKNKNKKKKKNRNWNKKKHCKRIKNDRKLY